MRIWARCCLQKAGKSDQANKNKQEEEKDKEKKVQGKRKRKRPKQARKGAKAAVPSTVAPSTLKHLATKPARE